MAFESPFFQGTQAQNIINNYLEGTSNAFAPLPPSSQNPYVVGGTPFVPPSAQPTPDPTIPNCDELYPNEGRVYDPVLQACVLPEVAPEVQGGDGSGNNEPEIDKNQQIYNNMLKDTGTIFGASNFLKDYVIDSPSGDILLQFDPNVNKSPLFFGLGDAIFGGEGRRAKSFLEGMQSYMDQGYGQYNNDGTYQIYTPEQYYNTVQSNPLQGLNASDGASTMTVGEAIDSVINRTDRPTAQGIGSGKIAEDLTGGLLGTSPLTSVDSSGNRVRNDDVYRSNIAKNIERNKRNFGNARFKEGFGFTGGR